MHSNAPKIKIACFIKNCNRVYFSLETLKKHIQKIHQKEYLMLKKNFKNQNFNIIYKLIIEMIFKSKDLAQEIKKKF